MATLLPSRHAPPAAPDPPLPTIDDPKQARCGAEIDWAAWRPTVRATLLFLRRGDEVLLIRKKRGLGAGKMNGPGGKIDPGETAAAAAVRETREEVGITARAAAEAGALCFQFTDGLALHCAVFQSWDFAGEPVETDEATPFWTPVDAVPYDEMWADDRLWLPLLFAGVRFRGRFLFEGDRMLWSEVEEPG